MCTIVVHFLIPDSINLVGAAFSRVGIWIFLHIIMSQMQLSKDRRLNSEWGMGNSEGGMGNSEGGMRKAECGRRNAEVGITRFRIENCASATVSWDGDYFTIN
jgi:hypothetical protein